MQEKKFADALSLSRSLSRSSDRHVSAGSSFVEEVELHATEGLHYRASSERLYELQRLQAADEVLSQVTRHVEAVWLEYPKSEVTLLRPYFENRNRLSVVDNILVLDNCIAIPQSEMLCVFEATPPGSSGG